jgi:hypothetical protein
MHLAMSIAIRRNEDTRKANQTNVAEQIKKNALAN